MTPLPFERARPPAPAEPLPTKQSVGPVQPAVVGELDWAGHYRDVCAERIPINLKR
jgi:hypothetical protein